ncbi:hypothetical protein VNO78_10323 [Psophocarpus tetragonolobus]|uniref:Uncharacterized protein n=1 Tax=Psophocarpus tetragonolobus TaxID=3891 RepID=A0AAN9SJX1_PSOTE
MQQRGAGQWCNRESQRESCEGDKGEKGKEPKTRVYDYDSSLGRVIYLGWGRYSVSDIMVKQPSSFVLRRCLWMEQLEVLATVPSNHIHILQPNPIY